MDYVKIISIKLRCNCFFSLWAHLNVGQVEFQNLSIGGVSIRYGELLLNTQLGVHQNPDHDQYFSTNVDLHNFFRMCQGASVPMETRSWFDPWFDAALYNKKQVWSVYICTTNVLSKLKFTKPQ